ncbi:zinc finger protein 391-like [Biomphalaria glabrata]|uniref:Zinc finger protein 391-like n=1 Tax=Biomphalaria glabrata TaxID=6526 RepID=A0A9U8DVA9_BIOGL|nr:zinc finger protein 391-like [Biomphalaria glabrata]
MFNGVVPNFFRVTWWLCLLHCNCMAPLISLLNSNVKMGRHCAVFGCYNNDIKINKNEYRSISFHCFPINNPEILNQWYPKIKRVAFKATIHSRICSEHFNEEDFQYQPFTNRRQLKRNAIPSKFYLNNSKRGCKKIGTSDVFSASAIDVYEKEKKFVSMQAPEHKNIQDISELNLTNQLEKQLVKLEKEEATDSDEYTRNINVNTEQCVPKNNCKIPVSSQIDQSKDKTFKKFECQICQKVFSSSSRCSRHKVTHTKEKPFHCLTTQKVFSRSSNVKTQQRIHLAKKTFKCAICQKDFSFSPNLMKHQKVHADERTFKCPICQKGFSTSSYLTRHQMLHADELPFRCDTCLGAFPYPTELKKHSLVPKSDEGFNGNICLQVFSSSSKLNQHKICRTEKKSFPCEACHQDLCFPSGFKKHLVACSGKKTIKCPVCQTMHSNCANLKSHPKTHKRKKLFKCQRCQKTFVSSSGLERHQRLHPVHMPLYVSPTLFQRHGHHHSSPVFERQFKCCLCNVVFMWRRKLEQHLHAHSQGNIWLCLLCNMNFTDIHLIEEHIMTHIQGMSV